MDLGLILYGLLMVLALPVVLVIAILWRMICIKVVGRFWPNYVNGGFATGYQAQKQDGSIEY